MTAARTTVSVRYEVPAPQRFIVPDALGSGVGLEVRSVVIDSVVPGRVLAAGPLRTPRDAPNAGEACVVLDGDAWKATWPAQLVDDLERLERRVTDAVESVDWWARGLHERRTSAPRATV